MNDSPGTAEHEGFDRRFAGAFFTVLGTPLKYLFRLKVDGLENVDTSGAPGILVLNHNWGAMGLFEAIIPTYAWYRLLREPPGLILQGGAIFFKFGILRAIAPRTGVVLASVRSTRDALRDGYWVATTPGALVDQYRPIWHRNRPRLQRVCWIDERPILLEQLAYVGAAAEGGHRIYPMAVSGTHEMAPVLLESTRLLRWTGLRWLRRDELWPSFPITLNHVINLALFLLSPWSRSIVAWVVFSLANIYVDMVYAYPIFPFQVRMRVGTPIQVPNLAMGGLSAKQRDDVYRAIHSEVERSLTAMLEELDGSRPWARASRWLARLWRRLVPSPPGSSGHEAAHAPGGP